MFGNNCSPNCSPLLGAIFIITDLSSHGQQCGWNCELFPHSDNRVKDEGLILDESAWSRFLTNERSCERANCIGREYTHKSEAEPSSVDFF